MDLLQIDSNAAMRPRSSGASDSNSGDSLLSPRTMPPTSEGIDSLIAHRQNTAMESSGGDLRERMDARIPDLPASPDGGLDSDLFLNLAQDGGPENRAGSAVERSDGRYVRRRRPSNQRTGTNETVPSLKQRSPVRRDFALRTRESSYNAEPTLVPTARRLPGSLQVSTHLAQHEEGPSPAEVRIANYKAKYLPSPQSPSVAPHGYSNLLNSERRTSFNETHHAPSRSQQLRPSRLAQLTRNDSDYSSPAASVVGRAANLRAEYPLDGAESTVSAAPSVMWDELAELRSRIQRIEAGERSSVSRTTATASNGSQERPRTASTAITTMSSSPKHAQKGSNIASTSTTTVKPTEHVSHPMLHQSLARCKDLMTAQLYRSLEALTKDALDLSALAGGELQQNPGASMVNGGLTDRQLRRKADNVCRSLTDLCIALYEDRTTQVASMQQARGGRRMSVDLLSRAPTLSATANGPVFERQNSQDSDSDPPRNSPSRALERVKQRRASTMALQAFDEEQQYADEQRNSLSPPLPPQSRASRLSAVLRQQPPRRFANENLDVPHDGINRPPSRAFTELGSTLKHRANRLSGNYSALRTPDREYTSQHPLPTSSGPSSLRRVTGDIRQQSDYYEPQSAGHSRGGDLFRRFLDQNPHIASSPLAEQAADVDRQVKRRSLGMYPVTSNTPRSMLGSGVRRTSFGRSNTTSSAVSRGLTHGPGGE